MRHIGTPSTSKFIKNLLLDGAPHHGFEIYSYVREKAKAGVQYMKHPTYRSILQMLRVLRYLGLVEKMTRDEAKARGLRLEPEKSFKGGDPTSLAKRVYFVIVEGEVGSEAWRNPQLFFRQKSA